jgi:hypothetical protein
VSGPGGSSESEIHRLAAALHLLHPHGRRTGRTRLSTRTVLADGGSGPRDGEASTRVRVANAVDVHLALEPVPARFELRDLSSNGTNTSCFGATSSVSAATWIGCSLSGDANPRTWMKTTDGDRDPRPGG